MDAPTPLPPLLTEAMKKAGLLWVAAPGQPGTGAWYAWHEGVAYVLTGPGEQSLPALVGVDRCAVTVRSNDKGTRILTWEAAVGTVEPGTDEWAAIAPLLQGKRLNLPDGEAAVERWARECTVLRLEPTGRVLEAGETLPDSALAAPPRPTPATTRVTIPFTVGRRARR